MTVETPGWVRDAVFYQIFPDRFASSPRVPEPGPLEPWDAPPSNHGFKGGDLLGVVEHLDYLDELGVTAIYLTPIFQSASNHRYHTYDYFHVDPLLGGDAALRELLDVAHERGMRVILDGVFNHTGRGLLAVPPHPRERSPRRPTATGSISTRRSSPGGATPVPYPPRERRAGPGSATRRWWGLPALPKLNTSHPTCASTCCRSASTGCASASTAGGWTCRPRSTTRRSGPSSADRCRAVQPRRVPRRRDLGDGARMADRRPVRCADELPAGGGDPRVRRRSRARHGGGQRPSRIPAPPAAARRARRSRAGSSSCSACTTRTWSRCS